MDSQVIKSRKLFSAFVFAAIVATSVVMSPSSYALKAEHEADRLLLAIEEALDNGRVASAEQHLEKIRTLGIALPGDYFFFNGKILFDKKNYSQARTQLESYVNASGRNGNHYREALELINDIEKQSSVAARTQTTRAANGQGKAEVSWSEDRNEYINGLKRIYDTDDPARALTRHINALLKFYAYGDARIITSSRMGTPTQHQLFTSSNGEVVSMNKMGAADNIPFTENRFSVYGINPYINFKCYDTTASCWLYHPITSDRWLQIVNNEDAAQEIAKAVSRLIKDLQGSG